MSKSVKHNGGSINVAGNPVIASDESEDQSLSGLISSSTPSLTSSDFSDSTYSMPLYEGVDVNKTKQEYDFKKIQQELNLFSALTNIYNAAKIQSKKSHQIQKPEFREPISSNHATIRKSESDDFQFPVYTGLVFHHKKQGPVRKVASEVPVTPSEKSDSIEEIKVEKTTASSTTKESETFSENESFTGSIESFKFNTDKLDTTDSNEQSQEKIDETVNSIAIRYLLKKSASTIKANKQANKEIYNQSLEKSLSIFRLNKIKNDQMLKRSPSLPHFPDTKNSKYEKSVKNTKIDQIVDSLNKPNKVILKKAILNTKEPKSKNKNKVTFKLPVEQVISYAKPKSASAYLRSYTSSKGSHRTPFLVGGSSYYGGSNIGYADAYNQQSLKKRYLELFDYSSFYGLNNHYNSRSTSDLSNSDYASSAYRNTNSNINHYQSVPMANDYISGYRY